MFVLYASFRYGWNEEEVGLTLAIVGACGMIVQGGVVKRVVADFGERRALLAGLLFRHGGVCCIRFGSGWNNLLSGHSSIFV